jgi:hypothetical protein
MRPGLLLLALPVIVGIAVSTLPSSSAEAKTVSLGVLSRSHVASACTRLGGTAFGISDDTAPYGCAGPYGAVNCTRDSDCAAFVKDTMPLTGNSLELILLGPNAKSGPTTIKPKDYRVTPAVTH